MTVQNRVKPKIKLIIWLLMAGGVAASISLSLSVALAWVAMSHWEGFGLAHITYFAASVIGGLLPAAVCLLSVLDIYSLIRSVSHAGHDTPTN